MATSKRVVQVRGKYLGDATMATILNCLLHCCAMLELRVEPTASRRPPLASPSNRNRKNPCFLPGGILGGRRGSGKARLRQPGASTASYIAQKIWMRGVQVHHVAY